jgi:hypothetical protein
MEIGMACAPLRQIRGSLGRAPCRDEHAVLRLVPIDRGLVHVVPRELVEDENRREASELVERRSQRIDVMQNATGDDCIERPGVVQLLQGDLPVEGTLRGVWIDRDHVIAGGCEHRSDPALAAAADLEDPPRRFR